MKKQKGITLIALVITIIIMLILVAVTVNYGIKSGLLGKTKEATADYKFKEEEDEIGKIQLEYKVDSEIGKTDKELKEYLQDRLNEKVDRIEEKNGKLMIYYPKNENPHIVLVSEQVTKEQSYIGYYADINNDGTVDGIIYADLAHSKSGNWNDSNSSIYEYDAKDNLKEYYISEKNHSEKWKNAKVDVIADVIAPIDESTGNDRFYVMSLNELMSKTKTYPGGTSTHYWYYEAFSKKTLKRSIKVTINDFGSGKKNTIEMIDNWNNHIDTYGKQTVYSTGKSYIDLWGAMQNGQYDIVSSEDDSKKWFVPSKSEWSAFGDYLYKKLNITNNYNDLGIQSFYWSSTMKDSTYAYKANFYSGCIDSYTIGYNYSVRLSTTF